jgi:ABC-type transport system substrate-binding protein
VITDKSTGIKYPLADFYLHLGNPVAGVWPRDYMEKVSHEAFRNKPVGTGPYMVDRWVDGAYVDLVKNPDYWDSGHAGYVDRIHMPIMDVETQWQEFQKGAIDFTSVPRDQVAAARDHPKVRDGSWSARAWPQLCLILVGMSQKSPRVGGPANLPLRQALSYSVDRAAAIAAKDNASTAATGLVPDGIPHDDAGLVYPSDAEKARQLVKQISPAPTLRYLSLEAQGGSPEGFSNLEAPLLSGWRSAGLDVTPRDVEWNSWIREGVRGEGELYISGWVADYPSADNFLYLLFHSSSSGAGTLWTFYDNSQVDRLLEEARRTLDESRRLDQYAQAEKRILADAPVIPLYFYRAFRVADSRVQNQALDPMGAMDMWKVWVK